jgi:flagellar basal-body rod protein FlgG
VRPIAAERIHTQGNLQQTSNNLDVAIQGSGFFQVLMPDGTTAYTRDGSFQTDSQGQLVTASGYPVQPALTIPANSTSLTIGRDGTVSSTVAGVSTQIGSLQLATFINSTGLQSQGENLYAETASSGTPSTNVPGTNGAGVLNQGFVETSNVNVVEELVSMIQAQRAYELNSKAITASDQMLQKLSQM